MNFPGTLRVFVTMLFALALPFIPPPPPTADTIMARVAANQDQSQAERAHFVYTQHARVASRQGKTVRCKEITDVRITPSPPAPTKALSS